MSTRAWGPGRGAANEEQGDPEGHRKGILIFFPAILIPACASSSPAFLMMYSAYTLNKAVGSVGSQK